MSLSQDFKYSSAHARRSAPRAAHHSPGGSARACLYCLPARLTSRHTGEAVHARRHVRTRLARRRHQQQPVPRPDVPDVRVFYSSARRRQPESFRKPPRGVHALGGGESAMPFGAAHAESLSARWGSRGRASKSAGTVHKQAHWRVRTGTPACPHTRLTPKAPALT